MTNSDTDLFLQDLRDLDLEEVKAYLKVHITELSDYAFVGNLLAYEALRLLYSPFISLKLAELPIYYGDSVQHPSSHALGLKASSILICYKIRTNTTVIYYFSALETFAISFTSL